METPFQRITDWEEGGPASVFARVDKILGLLGSQGVHTPVEDVSLKIVEVLTKDYDTSNGQQSCAETPSPVLR